MDYKMKTIIKYLETKGTIIANTFSKNYNPSHPEIIYWYLLHIFVYIINLYVTPYVLFNLVSSCVPWIFFKSEKFYKALKYLHICICIFAQSIIGVYHNLLNHILIH